MIGVERLKGYPHDKIVAGSSWLASVDHALIAAETLRNTAAALLCINAGREKTIFQIIKSIKHQQIQ